MIICIIYCPESPDRYLAFSGLDGTENLKKKKNYSGNENFWTCYVYIHNYDPKKTLAEIELTKSALQL